MVTATTIPYGSHAQMLQHVHRVMCEGDGGAAAAAVAAAGGAETCTMMVTQATRAQSVNYGCAVVNEHTLEVHTATL